MKNLWDKTEDNLETMLILFIVLCFIILLVTTEIVNKIYMKFTKKKEELINTDNWFKEEDMF